MESILVQCPEMPDITDVLITRGPRCMGEDSKVHLRALSVPIRDSVSTPLSVVDRVNDDGRGGDELDDEKPVFCTARSDSRIGGKTTVVLSISPPHLLSPTRKNKNSVSILPSCWLVSACFGDLRMSHWNAAR